MNKSFDYSSFELFPSLGVHYESFMIYMLHLSFLEISNIKLFIKNTCKQRREKLNQSRQISNKTRLEVLKLRIQDEMVTYGQMIGLA